MSDTSSNAIRPELCFDVWVRNHGEGSSRRIAEFVSRAHADAFAKAIAGEYDLVFVGGVVRDLTPEPVHFTINLNGRKIAEAEAMLTRLERIADQFDPYIDAMREE